MSTGKTGSREKIFSRISRALGAGDAQQAARRDAARARISAREAGPVPVRARAENFVTYAGAANAEIIRLAGPGEIPGAIAEIASKAGAGSVAVQPQELFRGLDFSPLDKAGVSHSFGPASPDDHMGLSKAVMGIGETGTLALLSGPESPVTNNFLPDIHLVALFSDDITGGYEDCWKMLRRHNNSPLMPRTLNWITGPSRTADIEQTLLLGAHGPRRLVILLIDGKE